MNEIIFLYVLVTSVAVLMFCHEERLDSFNGFLNHDWKSPHFQMGFFLPLALGWMCLPWSIKNEELGAIPWLFFGPPLVWKLRNFWKLSIPDSIEEPKAIHRRLIQLQHQLQKLQQKETLGLKLEKSNQSVLVLKRYEERFGLILVAIENHLVFGDHEQAERIITLFARHLRHILHESSLPFISTSEVLDHIQTYLQLMHLLSGEKFQCEMDDGMLDHRTRERFTEPLKITPWIEEIIFPYFTWAERTNDPIVPLSLIIDLEDDSLMISCHAMDESAPEKLDARKFKLLGSNMQTDSAKEFALYQVA